MRPVVGGASAAALAVAKTRGEAADGPATDVDRCVIGCDHRTEDLAAADREVARSGADQRALHSAAGHHHPTVGARPYLENETAVQVGGGVVVRVKTEEATETVQVQGARVVQVSVTAEVHVIADGQRGTRGGFEHAVVD